MITTNLALNWAAKRKGAVEMEQLQTALLWVSFSGYLGNPNCPLSWLSVPGSASAESGAVGLQGGSWEEIPNLGRHRGQA